MCINAGKESLPKVKRKQKHKTYWCELIVPKREKGLFWGEIWHDCGEPREGIVADIYSPECP